MLRIAVQSKGRLYEDTMNLLAEADIKVSSIKRRPRITRSILAPSKHGFNNRKNHSHIRNKTNVLDVPDIIFKLFSPCPSIAVTFCNPFERQPRSDRLSHSMAWVVILQILNQKSPRPDNAHVALQDIYKPRKFVD